MARAIVNKFSQGIATALANNFAGVIFTCALRSFAMAEKTEDGDSQQVTDEVLISLATSWIDLPGLEDRGAAGRIIIAGNALTRPDLDANWDVVLEAMKHLGSRPTVYALRDAVSVFFHKTRPKGKPAVTSDLLAVYHGSVLSLYSAFVGVA